MYKRGDEDEGAEHRLFVELNIFNALAAVERMIPCVRSWICSLMRPDTR